jgi:curved DNA-binding protein CbpA
MVARDIGNAYDLLGVKPDVNPSVLKKRYWKLSLLVHPDKCSHPQAHEAFMALNQAFKDLQDPSKVCFLPSALGQKCLLLV